ncbi:hypothetical protein [Absidia glauca]|uniref:Uncharacterized protein n=1 Tax=Absidia glauca TaxID=4829 RepID=A0A170APZ0_ABSGL|nr:hypothetical protein [Absidia glauca]
MLILDIASSSKSRGMKKAGSSGRFHSSSVNDLDSFCYQHILTDARLKPSSYPRYQTNDQSVKPSTLSSRSASCDSAARLATSSSTPIAAPIEDDDAIDDVSSQIGGGSFKTVLSYLQNNSEWIHYMDTVEQLEAISFLRVMYLGISTAEERHLVLKKLADGLPRSLRTHSMNTTPMASIINCSTQLDPPLPCGFRERKHHFLLFDALPTDLLGSNNTAALFEDNGAYIMEADFTTTDSNYHPYSADLILKYVHHHQGDSDSSTCTTTGIDLCVFFYPDSKSKIHLTDELDLLWKIHSLQIPILPILTMPTPHVKQRPTELRQNELAHLFSLWRIKMVDLSNLDVLDQPSFQRKSTTKHPEEVNIEERLGPLWARTSLVSPSPYHVLTILQFSGIEKWAISKLLSSLQTQAGDRCQGNTSHSITKADVSPSTPNHHYAALMDRPLSPLTSSKIHAVPPHPQPTFYWLSYALYSLPLLVATTVLLPYLAYPSSPSPWHASLAVISYQPGTSMTLMLNVYDAHGQPQWTPYPPLMEHNLPYTPKLVAPLPNKDRSLDGQYLYPIALPPCLALNDTKEYTVHVESPSLFYRVQGSPLSISRRILCDTSVPSDHRQTIIKEAWRHFMQHSVFYLRNSGKILSMVFTEGQEKPASV